MMFDLQDVTVAYDGIPALHNVSCTIAESSVTVITGSTGAGKTTLLRLLVAEVVPTSGVVLINGNSTKRIRPNTLRRIRRRIGVVEQNCKLMRDYSVYQNVLMPLAIAGLSKDDASRRALEILADVRISYVRHKYPHQLSGGERHLVALARALANQPEVIIADEPTGALDSDTSAFVATVIREIATRQGMSIILSTHSASFASAFPEAIHIHLQEGSVHV